MVSRQLVAGSALVALAGGMVLSAVLGPLGLGVIRFRVAPSAETQLIGGEVVALALIAPLAVAAAGLWLRGHPFGPALAFGPALYAAYMYPEYVIGAEYARFPGNNEYFFPLYAALILLGWTIGLGAWRALADQPPPSWSLGLRRAVGGVLIGSSVGFAVLWIVSIANVYRGAPQADYGDAPALFWLIRLIDLSFLLPVMFWTGAQTLRGASWAIRLSYAFVSVGMLLAASILGMAVVMMAHGDPAGNGTMVVVIGGFVLIQAALLGLMLRGLGRPSPSSRDYRAGSAFVHHAGR